MYRATRKDSKIYHIKLLHQFLLLFPLGSWFMSQGEVSTLSREPCVKALEYPLIAQFSKRYTFSDTPRFVFLLELENNK